VVVGRSQHATIGGCSVGGRLGAHDSAGGAVGMNQDGTPAPVCASSVLITSLQ
jgi:hypothetical protein